MFPTHLRNLFSLWKIPVFISKVCTEREKDKNSPCTKPTQQISVFTLLPVLHCSLFTIILLTPHFLAFAGNSGQVEVPAGSGSVLGASAGLALLNVGVWIQKPSNPTRYCQKYLMTLKDKPGLRRWSCWLSGVAQPKQVQDFTPCSQSCPLCPFPASLWDCL